MWFTALPTTRKGVCFFIRKIPIFAPIKIKLNIRTNEYSIFLAFLGKADSSFLVGSVWRIECVGAGHYVKNCKISGFCHAAGSRR